MSSLYLERALFVIGPQNSGKSVQLRSMFVDRRFGTDGQIPVSRNVRETIFLSNERRLHLRLTSPHEMEEDIETFLTKIESKTRVGRWCFAGALQIEADGSMPDVVETLQEFVQRFSPERARVCFLSPDRHGEWGDLSYFDSYIQRLLAIDGIEYLFIDARDRGTNGLLLADFFDFA